MNFIGVELGQSVQTPAPNGSSVSLKNTQGQSDFYSVLEKSIDTNDSREYEAADTASVQEPRSSDQAYAKASVQDRREEKTADRVAEKSQTKTEAVKEQPVSAESRKPDVPKKSQLREPKAKHIESGQLRVRKSEEKHDKKSAAELTALGLGVLEEIRPKQQELKPGKKLIGISESDLRSVMLERAKDNDLARIQIARNMQPQNGRMHTGEKIIAGMTGTDAAKAGMKKAGDSMLRVSVKKKDGKDALEETVSAKHEKHEAKVTILDLREAKAHGSEQLKPEAGDDSLELLDLADGKNDGSETKAGVHVQDDSGMKLRQAQITAPAPEANRFRQFMKEQGNADIVRDAKLTLKDESTGEIKLILKPEKLGEVRIRLSLEDNRIAGRIIVENNTVRAYFQENLAELLEEFANTGFDNASLDVFVKQENSRGGREEARRFTSKEVADTFDSAVPLMAAHDDSLVNLMV